MSIIGVLVATVVTQFLGVIWYSPPLFRNVWMRSIPGNPVTSDNRIYLAAAAGMFALSMFFDAKLGPYFGVHNLHDAIQFALTMAIPVGLLQISHTGFEGRKIGAYLVNLGFDAAILITVCASVNTSKRLL